jgi:hypothetical protein
MNCGIGVVSCGAEVKDALLRAEFFSFSQEPALPPRLKNRYRGRVRNIHRINFTLHGDDDVSSTILYPRI